MELISPARRGAIAVCIMLSACAAGPSGAAGSPANGAYGAFLAARYADAQDNPAVAAKYYTQALHADPGNRDFMNEGFLASLLAGSPQAGTLAPQLSGNALAVMLAGNQAAMAGNFAKATAIFATLPQNDMTGLLRPMLLAWAAFGQSDGPGALSALEPEFNTEPFGPIYVLNAALIADVAHDNKDAAQLYGAVAGGTPNLRLAEILASWSARQGDPDQANAELSALIQAHPDLQIAFPALQAQVRNPVVGTAAEGLAEAYLTLAGSLSQPSQNVLRLILLRFSLTLRPDLSAARLLLADGLANGDGHTPANQNQLQAALAALQPIGPGDPLYGPAALQQVNLLGLLNRPDDAVALLQKLIAANPTDPGLQADAGESLRGAGHYAEAIPYYNRALAALGTPVPAGAWTLYFDRGICEDQLGNWAAAEPDMQQALVLSPGQPYVLNYLGYSWAQRGEKLPQAHAMLQQAVGLDPNDGAVIDSLGYVNLRQGNTKTALSLLTQAVELAPDDAEVNGHLGDAFWQAGQKLQANYQWRRALALNPDPKLRAEIAAKLQQYFAPPA
jgi:tetratricopeptide (TPR) repeat protein